MCVYIIRIYTYTISACVWKCVYWEPWYVAWRDSREGRSAAVIVVATAASSPVAYNASTTAIARTPSLSSSF